MLVDVANPLDFSKGMPPTLSVCNDDSLGEQIQRAFPEAKVVKALNTVNAAVMVDPELVPGRARRLHRAETTTARRLRSRELLQSFGWPAERILDLGDITAARGTEMYLPLWLRLMGAVGPQFNIKVVH